MGHFFSIANLSPRLKWINKLISKNNNNQTWPSLIRSAFQRLNFVTIRLAHLCRKYYTINILSNTDSLNLCQTKTKTKHTKESNNKTLSKSLRYFLCYNFMTQKINNLWLLTVANAGALTVCVIKNVHDENSLFRWSR